MTLEPITTQILLEAIKQGDASKVAELLAQAPDLVNAQTESGQSAVLLASYYGEPSIAQLLVEMGASLDIFEAATVGKLDRVEKFLQADPSLVNAYAPDGFYPLGLACFFGHLPLAEFLLANGADVNQRAQNAQKVMPIHAASANGSLPIVKLLLEHGADVNAKQEGDFVPLHNAAQNGNVEMVQLFLDKGVDVNAANKDGLTALHFAVKGKHEEVAALLKQHCAV